MKKKFIYQDVLVFLCCWSIHVLFSATNLSGQDASEKIRARLSLEHITSNTYGHQLKATVRARLDESLVRIPAVKLNFYHDAVSDNTFIGLATTNQEGEAILPIPVSKEMGPLSGQQVYWVSLDNHVKLQDNTLDLQVNMATLAVSAREVDSLRLLSISLSAIDSNNTSQPIADMPVAIYVKRMFGLLPISEDFEATNEDGLLEYEFPQDIKGDVDGKIEVVIKIEEDEVYGTLLHETTLNWGIPLQIDKKAQRRELWSSRASAPIYLIVVTNALILIIWTVIVDVIRQIFLIRKFGRQKSK